MSKERLGAFMDAVIAIVMTILVLELEKPSELTLKAFWDLRINFAAYALSFLWLAAIRWRLRRLSVACNLLTLKKSARCCDRARKSGAEKL